MSHFDENFAQEFSEICRAATGTGKKLNGNLNNFWSDNFRMNVGFSSGNSVLNGILCLLCAFEDYFRPFL